ncbi:hypothetical protein LEN26_014242 [Aphanomyces euteiches]|nr:hypothetical protein LEN26_014242 [Aphanomyces euteiches]KAH9114620.1 hypothetical protein AeMF1_011307 [Aphanomyces euteiches]KAH9186156.1 hypothetical protein AeNC1_011866 [Aphanomyces euteiches]
MADNLFAGLNMDFNFADMAVPSAPPSRTHKRHKSNPDVLNHLAMLATPNLMPEPVPFATEPPIHNIGNSNINDMNNDGRGLSFIEDIDLDEILNDFLPDVSTAPHTTQLFHAHQLQENVLDMKRKSRHERHQSNPDGLLHHAQQLRMMKDIPVSTASTSSTFSDLLNMPPPRRSKKRNESTGLSQDMTQIALEVNQDNKPESESNRKSYKCGRCGQPKVGHVCTLPDLRNNWSQVDLAITRGMKEIDMNAKVISSRKYTVVHPDHVDHFFFQS